jgi:acylphosphatase
MTSNNIQMHVLISGIVQGVFFRAETQKKANENNVTGWVQNLDNGSVEAVLEGEKDNVNKVVEWCNQGPDPAFVSNVDTKELSPLSNFDKFEIK